MGNSCEHLNKALRIKPNLDLDESKWKDEKFRSYFSNEKTKFQKSKEIMSIPVDLLVAFDVSSSIGNYTMTDIQTLLLSRLRNGKDMPVFFRFAEKPYDDLYYPYELYDSSKDYSFSTNQGSYSHSSPDKTDFVSLLSGLNNTITAQDEKGRNKVIIIISDGVQSDYTSDRSNVGKGPPPEVLKEIQSFGNLLIKNCVEKIPIFLLGIGPDSKETIGHWIADLKNTGGNAYSASSDAVQEIFNTIGREERICIEKHKTWSIQEIRQESENEIAFFPYQIYWNITRPITIKVKGKIYKKIGQKKIEEPLPMGNVFHFAKSSDIKSETYDDYEVLKCPDGNNDKGYCEDSLYIRMNYKGIEAAYEYEVQLVLYNLENNIETILNELTINLPIQETNKIVVNPDFHSPVLAFDGKYKELIFNVGFYHSGLSSDLLKKMILENLLNKESVISSDGDKRLNSDEYDIIPVENPDEQIIGVSIHPKRARKIENQKIEFYGTPNFNVQVADISNRLKHSSNPNENRFFRVKCGNDSCISNSGCLMI